MKLLHAGESGSALSGAIRCGHLDHVGDLLRRGASPTAWDEQGNAAIHVAAALGHDKLVRDFLGAGASPVDKNGSDDTPIHIATRQGYGQIVRDLLEAEAGACLHQPDSRGDLPIHIAAREGHVDIVSVLLRKGDEKEAQTLFGAGASSRPLHLAVKHGHVSVVEVLLIAGADVNAREQPCDGRLSACNEHSALDLAVLHGHTDVLKAMMRHDANVNNLDSNGCTALHAAAGRRNAEEGVDDVINILIEAGATVDAQDHEGNTPLHVACTRGNFHGILALLRHNSDKQRLDREGRSPLYLVVSHRFKLFDGHVYPADDFLRSVEALMAAGANATVHRGTESALLLAAGCENNVDIVRAMIRHGASVNAPGHYGTTALHRAAWCNSGVMVDVLVNAGANVDAPADGSGWTPLHIAATPDNRHRRHSGSDAVASLLKHGADINKLDIRGRSPLVLAMNTFRKEEPTLTALVVAGAHLHGYQHRHGKSAVKLAVRCCRDPHLWRALFERGVDVKTVVCGATALHFASGRNEPDVIDALVEGGADLEATHLANGRKPLHCACDSHQTETVLRLLEHGANVNAQDASGITPLHLAADCRYDAEDDEDKAYKKAQRFEGAAQAVDLLLRWGADETIANKNGDTAEDVAGLERDDAFGAGNPGLSRVQLMLVRAPADRAWRRRSLLVLGRAFPERMRLRQGDESSCSRAQSRASSSAGGSVRCSPQDQGASGNVKKVLARLLGLKEDELFRKIVGFL